MKITEQTWEKKNLGVDSIEYCFSLEDPVELVKDILIENDSFNYRLCRVPAGRMDIAYLLQDAGYKYAEDIFSIKADIKELSLPKVYQKFSDAMTYSLATEDELSEIYNCIKKGVFDTDKVSLDPKMGIEKASNRFYNWCKLEVENKTSKPYVVKLNDVNCGFFILKDLDNRTADSLLAGLYDKENALGSGFATIYYPMLQAKLEGKKKIVTAVSSNNIASVKTHLSLGYTIQHINHVFIKHC